MAAYVKRGYFKVAQANRRRADDPTWRERNRQARLRWYRNSENRQRMAPISRRNGVSGGRPRKPVDVGNVSKPSPEAHSVSAT